MIKIYNIEWDTDGEIINDLPTEIIIDNPTDEMCEAVGGFDDVLADYLSDEYGELYCKKCRNEGYGVWDFDEDDESDER